MESAETALSAFVKIDVERNKARLNAINIVQELLRCGCIAKCSVPVAVNHLTNLFFKHGVEITTKEQRAMNV